MEFKLRRRWIHESAVSFALVDESGERVFVEAGGARWLVPARERVSYPAERFSREHVPPRVRELVAGRDFVEAYEQVLEVGERVQLVGYKTSTPDAQGTPGDYRSPPVRATLRSGPKLPLIIIRLRDLESDHR
jgi:hypothetical protein